VRVNSLKYFTHDETRNETELVKYVMGMKVQRREKNKLHRKIVKYNLNLDKKKNEYYVCVTSCVNIWDGSLLRLRIPL
jgi:hypothetical protein